MAEVYVLAGARTPFGDFGGSLKEITSEELAITAASAATQRAGIVPEQIDYSVFGQVVQSSPSAAYFARHVALRTGVPVSAHALTVNRLCGSGLQAVISAAEAIMLGYCELALAGGAESMSRYPYSLHGARFGTGLGKPELTDMLTATLYDEYAGCHMGETAERLADEFVISRSDQDTYAARSHQLATQAELWLAEEITPVFITHKQMTQEFTRDEHIRADSTTARLAALRPVFRTNGSVTAGNSSGINDGAAALVLSSEKAVVEHGLVPIARITGYGFAGVEPGRMGMGPVVAIENALLKAGWTLPDVDLFEINEAFAAQVLAVVQALEIPLNKVNLQGGAIALGHPVGASGARLLLTAALQLQRSGGTKAIIALCIGGGQGIAVAIEKV